MTLAGRPCVQHSDCISGYCNTDRCANNASGKPCVVPTARCPSDTSCHPISKYCLPPAYQLPPRCLHPWDCPWGSYCDKYHQCVPRFALEHRCNHQRQCAEGLACVDRHCRKRCLRTADCPSGDDCTRRSTGLMVCRRRLDLPPPPAILPLHVVLLVGLLVLLPSALLLFWGWQAWRRWRRRRQQADIPVVRSMSLETSIVVPAASLEAPIPTSRSALESLREEEQMAAPEPTVVVDVLPDSGFDLPVWPETNTKLPDPFDEDPTHTPIERTEFSSPLNMAAPIHADERPSFVLPKDPSLNSQDVWQ